ncbi:MAG: HAD family hydrolase [Pseudomonadota bacterium]
MAVTMKAIFLDKDGTLVDDIPFNVEPRRITLRNGAGAGLRLLARLDYRFFVVSNQSGVALGHFNETDLEHVGHRLSDLLFREQVDLAGFYYCPHHPDGTRAQYALACLCRKPMPGMLLTAAREHDIDLASSWMIGDILHDVEAGNRAGCRTVLIDNGNETEWKLGPRRVPTRIASDLYSAAVQIAGEDGPPR